MCQDKAILVVVKTSRRPDAYKCAGKKTCQDHTNYSASRPVRTSRRVKMPRAEDVSRPHELQRVRPRQPTGKVSTPPGIRGYISVSALHATDPAFSVDGVRAVITDQWHWHRVMVVHRQELNYHLTKTNIHFKPLKSVSPR